MHPLVVSQRQDAMQIARATWLPEHLWKATKHKHLGTDWIRGKGAYAPSPGIISKSHDTGDRNVSVGSRQSPVHFEAQYIFILEVE